AQYRNVPTQRTKGFDANVSYEKNFSFGKMELEGEASRTTYDKEELYPGEVYDYNGLIGEPKWTANTQVRLKRGDWTFAWSTNFVGGEDNLGYEEEDGRTAFSYSGPSTQITSVKDVFTHDFSVRYKGDQYEVTVGATNITDEQPPQISVDVAGTARLGTIPLTSQYYSLIQGRTAFVSLSRKF
ncbi:MAG: TonB-dependent receptor, partial [Steroidobacteraceae bacterium]